MAKRKGTKVRTLEGDLIYVFITGEGRNNAMKGEEPRMQYVASIITKKDSDLHKDIKKQIDAEWEDYKKAFGKKGLPKSTGIKDVLIDDPKGEIDPETEEVKKVPSGDVLITFKTSTTWPDGSAKVVNVFANQLDGTGKVYAADVTEIIQKADWAIGTGSRGIIHGVAQGNDTGDKQKVTLYLNSIQLTKLEKYTGDTPDLAEVPDEVVDLGMDMGTEKEPTDDQKPAL